LSLALGSAVVAPQAVLAEDADPNTGAISFSAAQTITTSYFFRGYNQEDTGLIYQPTVTGYISLLDSDELDIVANIGTWNSFHSEQTGGTNVWYESDIYGGLDFIFGPVTASVGYTFYFYPNGSFSTIQEAYAKIMVDESQFVEDLPFAIKPYALLAIETDDGNGSEDTYLEVGATPTFALGESGVTVAVPLALGMSLDDYYLDSTGDNELFGFGLIGINGTLPLSFVPAKYGAWSVTAGVNYIQMFADSAEAVNDGGEDYEVQGFVTLGWSY